MRAHRWVGGWLAITFAAAGASSAQRPAGSVQKEDAGSQQKLGFVGAPIPDYNEVMGFGLGAVGLLLYRLQPSDTISDPSGTAAFGMYFKNKTWVAGVAQGVNFSEDRYKGMLVAAGGRINFQFFAEPLGGFLDYSTDMLYLQAEFSRMTFRNFYVGLQYKLMLSDTRVTFGDSAGGPPDGFDEILDSLGLRPDTGGTDLTPLSGLGPIFSYDTRDNSFSPNRGTYAELKTQFNFSAIGSEDTYQKYDFAWNQYIPLAQRHTLAARLAAGIATGDVPFEDEYILGMQEDIRGYDNGRYRGTQLYAAQAEWRWNFWRRFGMVGFGGVAWVTNDASDLRFKDVLPGVGAGFRFMAVKEDGVNVGLDFAVGRDDNYSISIAITERF